MMAKFIEMISTAAIQYLDGWYGRSLGATTSRPHSS
jgi:hypothetical protein